MNLGLSGTFLYPAGKTPCAFIYLGTGPRGQNSHFLPGGTNAGCPRNLLKIHPVSVFFLMTQLALLPVLGFLKKAGGRAATPHLGPI